MPADGQIAGGFTQEEAQNLALILRSGALPATLTYLQEQTIGPTLGADSIRAGVLASLAGLLLISVFMLIYYKLSGVNAIVALVLNLMILLGMMAYVGAVMTLPGIAGFMLTIGIGVDSNVLIFERIKEELEAGKGVKAAINSGFSRVFLTLVDTHIAGFIAAAFLFQFGTGPIRGFAVTLIFGLISNLFTSTFISKSLFELVLSGRRQVQTLSHLGHAYFQAREFRFPPVAMARAVLSALVIAAGLFVIVDARDPARRRVFRRHEPRSSVQRPVTEDQIRGALRRPYRIERCRSYGTPGANQMLIRLPQTAQSGAGRELSADVPKVEQMLKAAGLPRSASKGTRNRRPDGRRGAAPSRASTRRCCRCSASRRWIAIRFRVSFARRLDHRDLPRRAGDARVPRVLPVRNVAQRHRGDVDDGRLLDERHDRHLRSRSREYPAVEARAA